MIYFRQLLLPFYAPLNHAHKQSWSPVPAISLYTDDVMLFCHPACEDITAVKATLHLFGRSSELIVNYMKSSPMILHREPHDAQEIAASVDCLIVNMPISYLGIPLTVRRNTSTKMQPVVDRVATQLPNWKAWLMNKAGHLAQCSAPSQSTNCLYLQPRRSQ